MPEINDLLSPKAIKQGKEYEAFLDRAVTKLNKLNTGYTAIAKGLSDVNKETKKAEKTQKNLDTVTETGNKLLAKRNTLVSQSDKELEELQKQIIKLTESEKKRNAALKESITGEKAAAEAKKKSALAAKEKAAAEKKATAETKRLATESKKLAKEEEKLAIASKKAADKAKEQDRAFNKLKKTHAALVKEAKDVAVEFGELSTEFKTASEEANELGDKIGKIEKNLGQNQGDVGKYGQAWEAAKVNLLSFVSVGALVAGAIKVIWQEISRTQGFQDKWTQGINASRAAMDVLTGSISQAIQGNGGFKDFNKRLDESISRSIELTKQLQILSLEQIVLGKRSNELRLIEELFKSIGDDATLSFQKREAANEKAFTAQKKRTVLELGTAKQAFELEKEIQNQQVDNGIRRTNEQLKNLATLKNAFDNARVANKRADIEFDKVKRELALDDFEQQLDFIFDVGDKRKTANEKLIADEKLTAQERINILADTNKILLESFDQQVKLFETENDIQIDRNKLLTLNNKDSFEYARGLGISERATNRLLEVIRERIAAVSDLDEAQKGLNESILKEREGNNLEKIAAQEKQIGEAKLTINEDILKQKEDQFLKNLKFEEDAEKESLEKRKELRELVLNSAAELTDVLFEIGQNQRDNELASINALAAAEITAAEGDAEAQKQIASRLKVDQDRIREEQFQADKNQALLKIGFNTAIGITAALTSIPPNVPLSIAIGVIGALQAGAVASKELPAFFKGTSDTPFEYTAGEKGSELKINKDGSLELTPDKTTHYKGAEHEHATIIPNQQTQQLLAGRAMGGVDNRRLEGKMDDLIDAVKKNKSNVYISKKTGNLNIDRFNKKYKKNVRG